MAIDTDISYFHNYSVSIRKSMKRYEALKRLFLSKYFFYTEYGEISMGREAPSPRSHRLWPFYEEMAVSVIINGIK